MMRGTSVLFILGALSLGARARACVLEVSVSRVDSESTPSGPLDSVLIQGADDSSTAGGKATAAKRCVYFYKGDVDKKSFSPTYAGDSWPYVRLGDGCNISAPPQLARLISVAPAPGSFVRINGLSLYQWTPEPSSSTCHCNVPKEGWSSVTPPGEGASFTITPVAVPPEAARSDLSIIPTQTSSIENVSASGGGGVSPKWTRLHGRLMIVGWIVALPLGLIAGEAIASPALQGGRAAFAAHAFLQTAGVALVAASFGLQVHHVGGGLAGIHDIEYRHGSLGVAATSLLFAQFLAGAVFRPHVGLSARRRAWEVYHTVLGRAALTAGVANTFTGMLLAKQYGIISPDHFKFWWAMCVAGLGLFWAAGAVVRKLGLQHLRARAAETEEREGASSDK